MTRPTWDEYFINMVKLISTRSKDENTKIGCVIVGPHHEVRSTGYNGFPRGINDNDPERQRRPQKYYYFEHAERNAIYNAVRHGVALEGCILYCKAMPCADCARGIIQSGILQVVLSTFQLEGRWGDSCQAGWTMMCESGIIVRYIGENTDESV